MKKTITRKKMTKRNSVKHLKWNLDVERAKKT